MPSNLSPGTVRKNKDKGYVAMVLIASADARVRRRWALGLHNAFAIHGVSERAELKNAITNFKPAVLLLDSDLPQVDRVKGVPTIQHLSPSTKIIVLSSAHNEKEAVRALQAGAKGYCNKDIELSLLRKAINAVQKGEIWVGRKTISHLLAELTSVTERHQKDSPALSEVYLEYLPPRERQIALLVGEGASNKEIAERLNISERTVKAHLTSIFQKLQIPDRLRLGLFVKGHKY